MIKKILFTLVATIFIFFLLLQLIPYGRNHTNPPVIGEPNWNSPQTRAYFYRACADCHSNETVWPWYSNIAPISWLIQGDVDDGRAAFNISEWGVRRENEGKYAAEQVQKGEMPPLFYLPMHPEARLSPQEKAEFIQGLMATFGGKTAEEDSEEEEED